MACPGASSSECCQRAVLYQCGCMCALRCNVCWERCIAMVSHRGVTWVLCKCLLHRFVGWLMARDGQRGAPFPAPCRAYIVTPLNQHFNSHSFHSMCLSVPKYTRSMIISAPGHVHAQRSHVCLTRLEHQHVIHPLARCCTHASLCTSL
jgi:hypothetical protein